METVKTIYLGELRTEATHLRSNNKILTDAPVDNQGKGSTFSPTDLFVTSLGSCMLTIIGIAANTHKFSIENTKINITKIMGENPRRVCEIHIDFYFPDNNYSGKEKRIIKTSAENCPVAKSIHPDILLQINYHFN